MLQFWEIRLKEVGSTVGLVWTGTSEEALGMAISLLGQSSYRPQGVLVVPVGRKLPDSVGKALPKVEGQVHRHVLGNVQPVH